MNIQISADIEECQQLKPCSHSCLNTLGSYRCFCPPGMSLSNDGHVCRGTCDDDDDVFVWCSVKKQPLFSVFVANCACAFM